MPQEKVEVAMHCVWLVDVLGDPVYTACKVCSSKIDPMTGKCKRSDSGCQAEAADAARILATVHLADWTGQLSNVLVGGQELALLSRVNDEQALVQLLQAKGTSAIGFRGPFDARLGTSQRLGQPRASGQQASQASAVGAVVQATQFQVLAARQCFGEAYDDDKRPMVKKVTRLMSEKKDGAVLPVRCPLTDLSCSDMGTFFLKGSVFANYVSVLAFAKDEPAIEELTINEERHLVTKHQKVFSHEMFDAEKPFAIEAFCHFTNCHLFNMGDGATRFLLGRVLKNEATEEVTLHVEWMCKVTDAQISHIIKEREQVWSLLEAGPTMQSNKRPATSLVEETPLKVKCGSWD